MYYIFNKALGLSGSIPLIVFVLTLLFVGIMSLIMFFHWKKYVISGAVFVIMEILYLTVVVVLLSTAFFSLI